MVTKAHIDFYRTFGFVALPRLIEPETRLGVCVSGSDLAIEHGVTLHKPFDRLGRGDKRPARLAGDRSSWRLGNRRGRESNPHALVGAPDFNSARRLGKRRAMQSSWRAGQRWANSRRPRLRVRIIEPRGRAGAADVPCDRGREAVRVRSS